MLNVRQLVVILVASVCVYGCEKPGFRNVIIPEPNQVEQLDGYYRIADNNISITITEDNIQNSPEGYELTITKEGVEIKAGTETGVFYAQQSLQQLIEEYKDKIPAQHIVDSPRFEYRGVHLDVSRHFQGKEFVMKQLKMFASLKINYFHFHLTDGIGWRLKLDSYPELAEKTGFKPAGFSWYTRTSEFVSEDTPGAVGGYFTKDDIREIIALADSLHITVLPEIELFGHSAEVFSVFPDLTCPVHTDREATEFCVGNEKTFTFLETVLAEVMDLFPSEYIHIGGDEASMRHWAICPLCQARMKKEGLKNVNELQSYGIARIEKFINGKGRKMIGWEEIAKGGLADNAALMSWRGVDPGQKAAATGHKVVFCPEPYCYLDAYQDAPETQPDAIGNYVPAMMTYGFDPAEGEFEGKENVWGVQANLWTEFVAEPEHAEHMYYPRVFALAEVGWTQPENKNYKDWRERAIKFSDKAVAKGYSVFDLRNEIGPRPGTIEPLDHLAKGCQVVYNTPFTATSRGKKPIDETSLTDGICGPWVNKYGGWMSFTGVDADVVVDLGEMKSIKEINVTFACFGTRAGYLPVGVDFQASADGVEFKTLSSIPCNKVATKPEAPVFNDFIWRGKEKTRYIRMIAHRDESYQTPVLPGSPYNPRPGQMFVDEIIVR